MCTAESRPICEVFLLSVVPRKRGLRTSLHKTRIINLSESSKEAQQLQLQQQQQRQTQQEPPVMNNTINNVNKRLNSISEISIFEFRIQTACWIPTGALINIFVELPCFSFGRNASVKMRLKKILST